MLQDLDSFVKENQAELDKILKAEQDRQPVDMEVDKKSNKRTLNERDGGDAMSDSEGLYD